MIFRILVGLALFITPFAAYATARWASKATTPWPLKALTGLGLALAIVGTVVMGLALEQTDAPIRLRSEPLERAGERPPGR